jgi:hypothetical protein
MSRSAPRWPNGQRAIASATPRWSNRAQRQGRDARLAACASTPCWRGVGISASRRALGGVQQPAERTRGTRGKGPSAASFSSSYFLTLERPDVTRPDTVLEDQNLDAFRLNYLSAVYPFQLLQRNVVVSLNFQRLYDLQSATDVASRFVNIDSIQRVSSQQQGGLFTISPAVAVQLTPTFSVGAAFNIWPNLFGNGWDQDVTVRGEGRVVSGNRIVPFVSQGHIQEEFRFRGFNVTAGFL